MKNVLPASLGEKTYFDNPLPVSINVSFTYVNRTKRVHGMYIKTCLLTLVKYSAVDLFKVYTVCLVNEFITDSTNIMVPTGLFYKVIVHSHTEATLFTTQ